MVTNDITTHPREFVGCVECGSGEDTWQKKRRLPQVGQTYECSNCGHEVYVYNAGDPGETIRQWRPVTDGMVTNLQFFAVVEDWPDSAVGGLMREGVERHHAIDYHVVELEGLTQTEWADMRGVDQSSVSENVAKAEAALDAE